VRYYDASCGQDGSNSLFNACTNAYGFANKLSAAGHTVVHSYSNTAVYDSDSIESDLISGGHDSQYTDVTGTAIEYYSMHGSCGNYDHNLGSCTTDSQCQAAYGSSGLTYRCDTISHTCSGYIPGNASYDRQILTCSQGDTFGGGANITSQMRFGEYSTYPYGYGHNGDANFVVFDTSCPFALPFLVEMNSQIFTGLHMELGFSTASSGDTGDSAVRGTKFATRLLNNQTVAGAWLDTSRLDDVADSCPGLCTIAMSCDYGSYYATWRINNETFTNTGDPAGPATYCWATYWCC